MSYAPGQNYQLRYCLAIALVMHGLLLFAITVDNLVKASAHSSDREVTITFQPSTEAPVQADFLAAENQLASGDSEQSEQPSNPQLALLNSEHNSPVQPLQIPESGVRSSEELSYRIITTIAETAWSIGSHTASPEFEQAEQNDFNDKTLAELSLAIASLEARLREKLQPEARKPRTLRITSTSALASDNADYVRQWRDRVETIGNLYYPEQARQQQLFGDVRLLVSVLASGVVEQISILSPSGHAVLDKAAIESIHLASPFEPFPPQLATRYDRIEVIRTWQFRKNRLTANAG